MVHPHDRPRWQVLIGFRRTRRKLGLLASHHAAQRQLVQRKVGYLNPFVDCSYLPALLVPHSHANLIQSGRKRHMIVINECLAGLTNLVRRRRDCRLLLETRAHFALVVVNRTGNVDSSFLFSVLIGECERIDQQLHRSG